MQRKYIIIALGMIVIMSICWLAGLFERHDRIELTICVGSPGEVSIGLGEDTKDLGIDWGDGTMDGQRKHVYQTAGDYEIVIRAPKLSLLSISNFNVKELNFVRCPNLKIVRLWDLNSLQTLDLSGCSLLEELYCGENKLENLDLSGCPLLKKLDCYNNQLNSLNISNCTNLRYLDCSLNHLSDLNIEKSKDLITLRCYNNKLTVLDLEYFFELKELNCSHNKLVILELPRGLMTLDCSFNQLTELTTIGFNLLKLLCSNNHLKNLNLKNCSNLLYLECHNNNLPVLNLLECYSILGASYSGNPLQNVLR